MPDLAPGESVTFTRIDTLPGVESLEAYNSGVNGLSLRPRTASPCPSLGQEKRSLSAARTR